MPQQPIFLKSRFHVPMSDTYFHGIWIASVELMEAHLAFYRVIDNFEAWSYCELRDSSVANLAARGVGIYRPSGHRDNTFVRLMDDMRYDLIPEPAVRAMRSLYGDLTYGYSFGDMLYNTYANLVRGRFCSDSPTSSGQHPVVEALMVEAQPAIDHISGLLSQFAQQCNVPAATLSTADAFTGTRVNAYRSPVSSVVVDEEPLYVSIAREVDAAIDVAIAEQAQQ